MAYRLIGNVSPPLPKEEGAFPTKRQCRDESKGPPEGGLRFDTSRYVPPHRRDKKMNMSRACVKKVEDPRKIFREVMKDLLLATHCHGCKREYPVTLVGYSGQYCKKSCWEMIWMGDLPPSSPLAEQMHSCYRFQDTSCKMCMEIPISKTISMYHRPYFESIREYKRNSLE